MIRFLHSKSFAVVMLVLAIAYVSLVLGARELATGPKTLALIFGLIVFADAIDRMARAWRDVDPGQHP
jgi:hypothetical protein